jgi:hypothetical protein
MFNFQERVWRMKLSKEEKARLLADPEMIEPLCPRCKRQFPKGWTASLRKRQGAAIKAALAKTKAEGGHIGRKRAVLYESIYRLRDEGYTFSKIAEEMQCSRGS